MAAVGEIRQNPGGRRLLVLYPLREGGARGSLWKTLQLNGRYYGETFGVPEDELDAWHRIGTLPADEHVPVAP